MVERSSMKLVEATTEQATERSYSDYHGSADLAFDPLKDLNLPASYEEVVLRYKRLRPEKIDPALN